MKKYLLLSLMLILLSSLVGTIAIANNDTNFFIDSRLPEKDKNALKEIMSSLDESDRKNVVLIYLDGSFTANRLELIDEFKIQNQNNLDNEGKLKTTQDSDISINYSEECDVESDIGINSYTNPSTQCASANSGPFRRVMSKTGYSRLTTNLYLPDKNLDEAYMKSGTNDKGYIYTGAVTSYGQIDMGLALNYESGSDPWNETWGMFVHGGSGEPTGSFGNYKMGSTVFLKYYTPQDNYAALYVSGYDKNNVSTENTIITQVATSKQFKANGSGMKMKRITSVAQSPENLTNGSYIKNVHWSNVKIGTTSGSEVLMDGNNTESFCGYKTTNVLVDYISQSDEWVWVKAGTLP